MDGIKPIRPIRPIRPVFRKKPDITKEKVSKYKPNIKVILLSSLLFLIIFVLLFILPRLDHPIPVPNWRAALPQKLI